MINFVQCGVKIQCQLHCRGLDRDYYQHYATLTATVCFSPHSPACRRLCECTIEIGVKVFEGRMERGVETISSAKAQRKVTDDERECHVMHITVPRIVYLDKIVYAESCPKVISLCITATLQATSNAVTNDSGLVDGSTSAERHTGEQ